MRKRTQVASLISSILKEQGIDVDVEVSVPENPANGDYTTNVAMKVTKQVKKSPLDIALSVKKSIDDRKKSSSVNSNDHNIKQKHQSLSSQLSPFPILQAIDRVEVAPPGFINVFLTEANLISQTNQVLKDKEAYGTVRNPKSEIRNSKIMVEYAHPNTHKGFHIGHLRNISTGESVVRLLEAAGYKVIRANYQGDVGLHIAKAIYALLHISPYNEQVNTVQGIKEKVEFLGKAYASGSKAFEDKKAQEAIKDINFLIYAAAQRFIQKKGVGASSTDYLKFVHGRGEEVDEVYQLWKETRQWSLDYFETIYARVGSHYDRYYFEGECLAGVDLAREAVKKGVLKEDGGAVIFDGKPYGLDTRVFVNSLGLPTYEAKELALAAVESTEFGKLNRIIHVVGPEQASFFTVTFKVEELLGMLEPGVQYHLAYGWVKLKHGKMSSRSGNVVLGEWLLDEAKKAIEEIVKKSASNYTEVQKEEIAEKAAVAAVKYSFLRVSTQSEIAFDLKESINLQGDSGPYLQYTYARCKSVLRKAGDQKLRAQGRALNSEERAVARLLMQFPDVVAQAATNFAPSTLCSYLNKLAQAFNLFYAKHEILPNPSRLALTAATAQVLANGLYLLGIETLEQM